MNKRQKKKIRKYKEEHGHWYKTTVQEMFKKVGRKDNDKALL